MVPRITEFSYSVGEISQINGGHIERQPLPTDGLNQSVLKSQPHGLPKFLGIYQRRIIMSGGKRVDERLQTRLEKALLDATDAEMEFLGLEDPIHPYLIMLCHDSHNLAEDTLAISFDDRCDRVAVHPIDLMPDLYRKNIDAMFELMARGTVDPRRYSCNTELVSAQDALSRKMEGETKAMITEMKTYGLDRDEWLSLTGMLPRSSRETRLE